MKKYYNPKSKTHLAATGVAILGGLMTFLPTVMEFIPVDWYGRIFIAIGVLNIILRNVTTKPVSER